MEAGGIAVQPRSSVATHVRRLSTSSIFRVSLYTVQTAALSVSVDGGNFSILYAVEEVWEYLELAVATTRSSNLT